MGWLMVLHGEVEGEVKRDVYGEVDDEVDGEVDGVADGEISDDSFLCRPWVDCELDGGWFDGGAYGGVDG